MTTVEQYSNEQLNLMAIKLLRRVIREAYAGVTVVNPAKLLADAEKEVTA